MSESQGYWGIFVQGHTAALTEGQGNWSQAQGKDVTTHPYGEENT